MPRLEQSAWLKAPHDESQKNAEGTGLCLVKNL
jgi:hypothetical protein